MDKIVETCKENGIKLILVEIPSADSWSNAKSQAITEYANNNGLIFNEYIYPSENEVVSFIDLSIRLKKRNRSIFG